MSVFKIGDSPFRPASGVANGKKAEPRSAGADAAPVKGGFDAVDLRANPLAVMPRMSAVESRTAQRLQSGSVESLLKASAAELDGFFTDAYGFGE